MARMLVLALKKAGYEVEIASEYISYSKRHAQAHLDSKRAGAIAEAKRLLEQWNEAGQHPDLWFCYHPYDKSPDWLGMEVCRALNIPMVTAEPCKTGQGPHGEWVPWRQEAQKAIKMADMNIVMTHSDLDYLSSFVDRRKIVWMPPFIDADLLTPDPTYQTDNLWPARHERSVKLLTVGMMRPGAKMQSYTVLAQALQQIADLDWSLVLAGGGPGSEAVEGLFAWAGERVVNVGERSADEVISLMQKADILAWPGCREAYGMVYLEAATFGVPAAALDNMGVPLVVLHDQTGLLANPADVDTYAATLGKLISDNPLRARLGKQAAAFAMNERSGATAARRLKEIIDAVLGP